MNSGFLKLNINDFWKGFILAVITAILTGIYNAISTTTGFAFTWEFFKPELIAGLLAGIGYLIKNIAQNNQGVPFSGDKKPQP